MPVLDLSGERFRVEFTGPEDGPPLILSHALGLDLAMWDAVVPLLARRRRVVRYDARGHGESAAPDQVYSMGDLGRDVLAIMDRLGLASADFCGLSLGGMVGQWLALNAPARLTRLVLANTTAHAAPVRFWDQRIRAVRREGLAPIADAVVDSWVSPAFRAAAPQRVAMVRAQVAATPPSGYMGTCCAMRDMDFRRDLARIRTATLVIVSEQDRSTPPGWGEAIAEAIPGARLERLAGGHLSALEQPEAFVRAVDGFLG
ncbi:3-oxoadipate enol-lactonase [Xanthobacter sp. V3C-3]|uniref:3-oxoadipate enol-lactonase n=1 Tax=Xanthobacter lutulentifluminis TaxID=3119935 RepID=UPI00372962F6